MSQARLPPQIEINPLPVRDRYRNAINLARTTKMTHTTTRERTPVNAPVSPPTTMILFGVGAELYGMSTHCLQEVLPLPELVKLPTCPEFVDGFLNLGGVAIPVLRLSRLLGVPSSPDHLYTPLLMVASRGHRLALLVDRVIGIVAVDEEKIVPVSRGETINDCALGMASVDEGTAIVLDANRLLLKEEKLRLNQLRQQAQQRIAQVEVNPE